MWHSASKYGALMTAISFSGMLIHTVSSAESLLEIGKAQVTPRSVFRILFHYGPSGMDVVSAAEYKEGNNMLLVDSESLMVS